MFLIYTNKREWKETYSHINRLNAAVKIKEASVANQEAHKDDQSLDPEEIVLGQTGTNDELDTETERLPHLVV